MICFVYGRLSYQIVFCYPSDATAENVPQTIMEFPEFQASWIKTKLWSLTIKIPQSSWLDFLLDLFFPSRFHTISRRLLIRQVFNGWKKFEPSLQRFPALTFAIRFKLREKETKKNLI